MPNGWMKRGNPVVRLVPYGTLRTCLWSGSAVRFIDTQPPRSITAYSYMYERSPRCHPAIRVHAAWVCAQMVCTACTTTTHECAAAGAAASWRPRGPDFSHTRGEVLLVVSKKKTAKLQFDIRDLCLPPNHGRLGPGGHPPAMRRRARCDCEAGYSSGLQ